MDADSRDICIYLKSCPGQFISAREISRRAGGKRRFRNDPNWAVPILARLVEQRIIESDSTGHYRLIPRAKRTKIKRTWLSPQIRTILQKSGKGFSDAVDLGDPDDFPDILP